MQMTNRKPQSPWDQWITLFRMELTNWRWSWRSMVLSGTLAPILSILALGTFAQDAGKTAVAYVLSGNIVLSLMFGNMDNIQSRFTFMRFTGTIDYFTTLPIKRYVLILAMVIAFLLLSLPSLLATMLTGILLLRIPINIHPLIVVIVPLCAISLSGIGALIGTIAPNPQTAGSFSLLTTLIMLGLGPVVIPPDRLSDVIVRLGFLSPATYAASALRQVLFGQVTERI